MAILKNETQITLLPKSKKNEEANVDESVREKPPIDLNLVIEELKKLLETTEIKTIEETEKTLSILYNTLRQINEGNVKNKDKEMEFNKILNKLLPKIQEICNPFYTEKILKATNLQELFTLNMKIVTISLRGGFTIKQYEVIKTIIKIKESEFDVIKKEENALARDRKSINSAPTKKESEEKHTEIREATLEDLPKLTKKYRNLYGYSKYTKPLIEKRRSQLLIIIANEEIDKIEKAEGYTVDDVVKLIDKMLKFDKQEKIDRYNVMRLFTAIRDKISDKISKETLKPILEKVKNSKKEVSGKLAMGWNLWADDLISNKLI